jgi:methylenetetrahydrofolate reductase (NADPH)
VSATTPTTSGLAEAIGAGRFVLTTSLGTLGGITREELRRRLRVAKEGFAFVKFGDNPRARARPSPWAAAAVALAEGLEPVAHVTCRDRNRLALESDLMGGRLLGVRNVLCLRGDEVELSDEPDARAVHHLDVVDLIGLASRGGEGELYLLAGCDPNAGASDSHFARLRQKLDAGASVLESQPVFDGARFADWLTRLRQAGIDAPLLVDISVVTTPGEARLLQRIPFIRPPEALEARVRRDRLAGIALAAEVARAVRELPGVAGCHISSLRGDPEAVLAVAERI